MSQLENLRQKHPTFFFERAEVQHDANEHVLVLLLKYRLADGPEFTTTYRFPHISAEVFAERDHDLVQRWATNIGMVEGLSYWKLACSPKWVVNAPGLSQDDLPFWDELLKKGLSEFFFINTINAWEKEFIQFELKNSSKPSTIDTLQHAEKFLIPVGGGKDSVVTTELLKKANLPITTFSVNMYPQLKKVLDVYWEGQTENNHIHVQRSLDSQLITLNNEGYFNGHTPFSAMVAFVSTFAAYLYDYSYIPLSNEWSANEGNTIFLGQTINHQYSKTVEFEKNFRHYLHKNLSTTVEYFSFLRPLHELQIAEQFIKFPQYLPVFLSCNVGQKKGEWCGECPKCLFVAIMLSAFLSNEQLDAIFKKDILNNENLRDTFDQLLGFAEVKSLECVGTRQESQAAVTLAAQHLSPLPKLLQYGWDKLRQNHTEQELFNRAQQLRQSFIKEHFWPKLLKPFLENQLPSSKLHQHLHQKYDGKNILVLGWGREGQSTYKLLRETCPEAKISISDEHPEKHHSSSKKFAPYLKNLEDYDVIFKTPGIPVRLPELQSYLKNGGEITSQLNEFLAVYKSQTYGVTGTKGKSTTSSLITHFLKALGHKTLLAGNIGLPVFEIADQIESDTTVILETSSYQLETVEHSPHIALLLNLFPEHINYHQNLQNYAAAKGHITKFQTPEDIVIFNKDHQEIVNIAVQSAARQNAFSYTQKEIYSLPVTKIMRAAEHLNLPTTIKNWNFLPAVLTISHLIETPEDVQNIIASLETFQPLPHRLQVISHAAGIKWIDDTLATIPEATIAGLNALGHIDTLMLGGFDRGITFDTIVDEVVRKKIPTLIFFKPSGETMFNLLRQKYPEPEWPKMLVVEDMQEAVTQAYRNTPQGGTVLLSPSSPSFGQFKDYEDKAEQFKSWIGKLKPDIKK